MTVFFISLHPDSVLILRCYSLCISNHPARRQIDITTDGSSVRFGLTWTCVRLADTEDHLLLLQTVMKTAKYCYCVDMFSIIGKRLS